MVRIIRTADLDSDMFDHDLHGWPIESEIMDVVTHDRGPRPIRLLSTPPLQETYRAEAIDFGEPIDEE